MKNVSNYADLLVNVHNLLTFPSNSVELRIFNIYGNIYSKYREKNLIHANIIPMADKISLDLFPTLFLK